MWTVLSRVVHYTTSKSVYFAFEVDTINVVSFLHFLQILWNHHDAIRFICRYAIRLWSTIICAKHITRLSHELYGTKKFWLGQRMSATFGHPSLKSFFHVSDHVLMVYGLWHIQFLANSDDLVLETSRYVYKPRASDTVHGCESDNFPIVMNLTLGQDIHTATTSFYIGR